MAGGTRTLLFLGSANWDGVAAALGPLMRKTWGVDIAPRALAFGQYAMDLVDPGSALRRDGADIVVFAERLEDLWDPLAPFPADPGPLLARGRDYIARIRAARDGVRGIFVLHALTFTRPALAAWDPAYPHASGPRRAAEILNAELAALAAELPDCHFLPLQEVVEDMGRRAADPGKYFLMGRFPFSMAFAAPYAQLLAGLLMSLDGATARVLVLDLDNTLWGGVIGDDGVEGIQLGPDFPGNTFKVVQHLAKSAADLGMILTMASKNTEAVALEAIERHPDMVLGRDDFVTWQINWEPKSANIRRMAEALDLGPGAFLFIDDNPVERNDVRENCPGVIVPEMPGDVSDWPAFLARHPAFYRHQLTETDRNKTGQYRIRAQVSDLAAQAQSREDFLHQLGMGLGLRPVEPLTRARALQLIQKTNQFNTTTRRYTEADLDAITAQGGETCTVRITDRYGSDEIIAVVVVRPGGDALRVDNFIMSCRVLGRGVEQAVLALLAERALARGLTALEGEVIETPRNAPCRDVYTRHGFETVAPGLFRRDLVAEPMERPAWFAYDGTNA